MNLSSALYYKAITSIATTPRRGGWNQNHLDNISVLEASIKSEQVKSLNYLYPGIQVDK